MLNSHHLVALRFLRRRKGFTALLSRDFLVLVGFAVAMPLAVIVANRWLESFAYRTPLGGEVFVVAGLVVVASALPVVAYHALRAATTDPVRALRSE